jgi:pimeloyl-ACP methyl ester carboxylesterase
MPEAKQRGLRYWILLLSVIGVLGTFFVESIFSLINSSNPLTLIWSGVLFYFLTAVLEVYRSTSPARLPLFQTDPEALEFEYKEVEFPSRDGLTISGWLIPPKNGSTIILTHGVNGNRLAMASYAQILINQGYGVLLYDLRAHGRSHGNLCTWGWLEVNDLLGAVDFLRSHRDVDVGRIGAFGFSLGGQITLRAAFQEGKIRAVVADGPSKASVQDHSAGQMSLFQRMLIYPWLWIVYNFQSFITGVSQPDSLVEGVRRVYPRPLLLISTGKGSECNFTRVLYDLATEPKSLYEIPEARHGQGLVARQEEYETNLVEFFDRALLENGQTNNDP